MSLSRGYKVVAVFQSQGTTQVLLFMGKVSQSTIFTTHFMAIGYFIVMWVISLWLEIFEIIPFLFQNSNQLLAVNLVLFIYAMISVVGNYYCLVTTDTSCETNGALNEERDGVFYCQSCARNSPPRAHHCSLCDRCILGRDHHCYFAGTCIGHANARFFVVYDFFVFITSAYVVVINLIYLHQIIGPFIPLSFEAICKIVPLLTVFKLWSGSVTLFHFLVIVVTWLGIMHVLGCSVCFFFQMSLIFSGQTTYEWQHNIFIYDQGWRKNFLGICGSMWYLWWLFPVFQMQKLASKEEDNFTQYNSKISKYI